MPDSLPIRLIATDVDGTLLNNHGIISEANLRAIHAAQEKGITVAIASGRFPENVYVLLEDYGLSCAIIGTNGAKTTDANLHVLSEHFMLPQAAMAVHDALTAIGNNYFIFAHDQICTAHQGKVHHTELSQGDRIKALGLSYTNGPEAALACCRGQVQKFFVCDDTPLPPIRAALEKIPDIELTQSGERNIEIMPRGVDKGSGVKDLAAALGIPLSQVMTLGDQKNDIPMLRVAGYGVAMGNACVDAKAAARFVTGTNDENGFAQAIEKYAL